MVFGLAVGMAIGLAVALYEMVLGWFDPKPLLRLLLIALLMLGLGFFLQSTVMPDFSWTGAAVWFVAVVILAGAIETVKAHSQD